MSAGAGDTMVGSRCAVPGPVERTLPPVTACLPMQEPVRALRVSRAFGAAALVLGK